MIVALFLSCCFLCFLTFLLLASNTAVRNAAFAYVLTNWKDFVTAGGGASRADRLITPFRLLSDEPSAKRIRDFVAKLDDETKSYLAKAAAQTGEEILAHSSIRAAGLNAIKSLKVE
jgi:hypothetical protein